MEEVVMAAVAMEGVVWDPVAVVVPTGVVMERGKTRHLILSLTLYCGCPKCPWAVALMQHLA